MINQAFNKAKAVINSSENEDHIKGAANYINNFFIFFSTPTRKKFGPFKTFYADDFVVDKYLKLKKLLKKKKKSLKIVG